LSQGGVDAAVWLIEEEKAALHGLGRIPETLKLP
jgi:hypothetical protein